MFKGERLWRRVCALKPYTLALLAMAVGALLYEGWLFVLLLHLPSDHASIYLGRQVIVKYAPPLSPLKANDVIVAIDDMSVHDDLLWPSCWHEHFFREGIGRTHGTYYTILRDGEQHRIFVTWYPYTIVELFWRGAGLWVVGTGLILTAIIMATARRDDQAAAILGLSFVMTALNQVNNVFPASGANTTMAYSWLFIPVDAVGVLVGLSAALHGMLIFPEVKAPIRRYRWLPWVIYLTTPTLSLAAAFLLGGDGHLEMRATMFNVANPLMILQTVLMLVAMGHTYVTSHRPGVRNQIRWIIWGAAIPFAFWTVLYVIPSLFLGSPWLPLAVTNVTLILVPLAFAIAIFRFGLMEVDRWINYTLVYLLSGVLLFLLYVLLVSWIRTLLPPVMPYPTDLVAGLISMLVLLLLFNPVRIYTQRLVNQLFFREQLNFYRILTEIGSELSTMVWLEDVRRVLDRDVAQQLGLTFATALLLDERQGMFVGRNGNSRLAPITATAALPRWLREHGRPLFAHRLRRLPADVRAEVRALVAAGMEVCMPLMRHNRLLGMYVFGPKTSGNLLNRDEVNALELLSQQAATAIQNARLYEEIQQYNRLLEARVAARTAELTAERNRLDTIVQNIADGLVATDAFGNIVLANPAFSRIVRLSVERVLGRSLAEVLPSERLLDIVAKALAQPGQVYTEIITGDIPGVGGRASQVYKASACAMLQRPIAGWGKSAEKGPTGEVMGVVTVLRDITHEYEVDRMKTDYISTVSHELRTPLTSVLGFAKLIRKSCDRYILPRLADEQDPRVRRAVQRVMSNLDIIISEGERLTRLINDVLDIAKMEAGKIEWHMAEVDIRQVIQASVDAMRAWSLEKGVPILVKGLEEAPPMLVADDDRLVQVMTNLLSNALKFTAEGQITVQVRTLRVTEEGMVWPPDLQFITEHRPLEKGLWLMVSVQDTGIGIPKERLSDVFEKFKQVSSDVLPDTPHGTGLGLPICREIVEYHGGMIWVESEVGVGSTFSFVLPAIDDGRTLAAPEARPVVVQRPVGVGQRILVVDDEESFRSLLRQELEDAGYQVLEAADGMTALKVARSQRLDLIILDVMIPGISGFDVVSVLRGDPATAAIPIVILSGVEDRERGFRLGADGYLVKPLDVEKLFDVIHDIFLRAHRNEEKV